LEKLPIATLKNNGGNLVAIWWQFGWQFFKERIKKHPMVATMKCCKVCIVAGS